MSSDRVVGDPQDVVIPDPTDEVRAFFSAMGKKGGRVSARRVTPDERVRRATIASRARWQMIREEKERQARQAAIETGGIKK